MDAIEQFANDIQQATLETAELATAAQIRLQEGFGPQQKPSRNVALLCRDLLVSGSNLRRGQILTPVSRLPGGLGSLLREFLFQEEQYASRQFPCELAVRVTNISDGPVKVVRGHEDFAIADSSAMVGGSERYNREFLYHMIEPGESYGFESAARAQCALHTYCREAWPPEYWKDWPHRGQDKLRETGYWGRVFDAEQHTWVAFDSRDYEPNAAKLKPGKAG